MDTQSKGSSDRRERLLVAAELLMLQRGYWGTSVDDVCRVAGVSKGTFFHYFNDKEQLALAALDRFVMKMAMRVREAVQSKDAADAYGRICAYCDLVADAAQVQHSQQGCLIAAFVMESHPEDEKFAEQCAAHFGTWIRLLRDEFVAALSPVRWSNPAMATELAQLCVCVVEGALILARGRGDPQIVATALDHFKRYIGATLEHAGCLPSGTMARLEQQKNDAAPGSRGQQLAVQAGSAARPAKSGATRPEGGRRRARVRKDVTTSKR